MECIDCIPSFVLGIIKPRGSYCLPRLQAPALYGRYWGNAHIFAQVQTFVKAGTSLALALFLTTGCLAGFARSVLAWLNKHTENVICARI